MLFNFQCTDRGCPKDDILSGLTVALALVPEAGSSAQLVTLCGYQKAAELLMLGEPFSAGQALEYGIVSRLCRPEDLMDEAMA